jgi:tRNA (mo5U34)-methyltransferase
VTQILESRSDLERRIAELGPWFHDLEIGGVRTAPAHPLGNFLEEIWLQVRPAFPARMHGMTVLDVGCNAGFYSLKLAARGARVTGIEHDARYVEQARFAAAAVGAEIEYIEMDVYDVGELGRTFDFVLFMGVFYHLRHPLLALDRLAAVVRRRMVFQSLLRGRGTPHETRADYPIEERAVFDEPDFPAMRFIERSYAGDPTNWWIPNRSGMEAMLRSAGLTIEEYDGNEVFFCAPGGR